MALNSILLGLFACATFISSCSCFCETSDFGQNHYTCNTLEDLAKISKKNEATTIVVKQHQMPFRCSQPVFQDFPKTRQIRIQDGAVISVGQNCFIGLYEIDEIDLKYNRITDFDASSLNGSNVSWLILTGNQLTSMGFKELVLPKLRHLILSKNKLNNLIVERGNFPTLIEISADNNEITSFQIVNNEIYSLTISENKIRAFFADNLRAPNLHFLHLERNKLTGIHSHALQNLPKLKEIRLEGNPIEMVDFGFANVTHFRITDDNIIITQERKEEPLSIFVNWENVQRLILSSNKIKTFKIQRYVSNGIEELKLDNNLIETIDRDDLKIFNNLFMLDLSNNRISSINYDSFSMLRKLHTLNLNNNCIQSLSASLFNSLPSIVNINLSYNLITYFPIPGWNNQTQEVRMTEFHPILTVQELTLAKNPIQCSCKNLFLDWAKNLQNYAMLQYNLFDTSDLNGNCMETNQRCRSYFTQQSWAALVPNYLRNTGRETYYQQCDTNRHVVPSENPLYKLSIG